MPIDWNRHGRDLAQEINATAPVVHALGTLLTLSSARFEQRSRLPDAARPGEFIVDGHGLEIACADGSIMAAVREIRVNDVAHPGRLLDFCERYRIPTSGSVYSDPHESFEATQLYARTTETVKESDGFRHGYFHKCLARNRRTAESLIRRLNLEPGAKIMDLACGTGWFAWLMAEFGMDSHACDFFMPEYFPESIRTRVRYSTADLFVPWTGETDFDLVFLRGLTNEHRAKTFLPEYWDPFLHNLVRMIGDRGAVYWVLMRSPRTLADFDRLASRHFPHREYRNSGYCSATLSLRPFPPPRAGVNLPGTVTEECCRHVFEDLERNDRRRIARGVYLILNQLFRSIAFDFSIPFYVAELPVAGVYFQMALRQHGFLREGGLGSVKKEERCVVICGEQAPVPLSEFPLAVFWKVSPAQLVSAWLNCPDVFVCQDQDENFFAGYLERIRVKEVSAGETASGPKK